MTTFQQQTLDRIEADRRQRERELLLLLLLLADDSRQHAQSAVRLGVDPGSALRNVIIGHSLLDQPGLADALSERMVDAYGAGMRRAFRLADQPVSLTIAPLEQSERAVRTAYNAYAAQAAQSLAGQLADRVTKALREDWDATVNERVRLIREAFKEGGYHRINPSALERIAETTIIRAYQDGYGAGFSTPIIRQTLKGFRYVALIDDRTTEICRAYDGVQLPADDPWFQGHAPPCHFGCRSTYVPLWRDFEPTVLIPSIEPQPGWGTSAISPLTRIQ